MNAPTSLRTVLLPWVFGSTVLSVVVLVVVLSAGGGAPQPSPAGLPDAGPVTGCGLPVVRLLVDLAGCLTVGLALVASRVIHVIPAAADEALPAAGRVAAVWGALAVVQSVLFMSEAQATLLLTTDLGTLRELLGGSDSHRRHGPCSRRPRSRHPWPNPPDCRARPPAAASR